MNILDDENRMDRMCQMAVRQVLSGDSMEDVIHSLAVNGVTGPEAGKIYEDAVSERVEAIRAIYWRGVIAGVCLVVVGLALLAGAYFLTEGFTVFNILVIIIPTTPLAFGAWKLLNGISGVLTARSRTGPISEIV